MSSLSKGTVRIKTRQDTASNWTSQNPTLGSGEFGYETDTSKIKVGDGSTAWTSLSYLQSDGGDYQINIGGRARCQNNNWYYVAHVNYGPNYYYYYSTTGSTSNPSTYVDSVAPYYLVPKNGTITGYTIIGNISTTDTWEWFCGKLAQPTFGSAGNWTVSQVGATQSAGGTANILYKWEQTGLSVAVNKNDSVGFWFRRTTDNDLSYSYCEFSAYITLE
jgi:hypothetical protein